MPLLAEPFIMRMDQHGPRVLRPGDEIGADFFVLSELRLARRSSKKGALQTLLASAPASPEGGGPPKKSPRRSRPN
jgi:hypothetical protein